MSIQAMEDSRVFSSPTLWSSSSWCGW